MGRLDALRRRIQASGEEAARQLERIGLATAARLAARWLGEELPDDGLDAWQHETLGDFLERLAHDPDGDLPAASQTDALAATLEFVGGLPAPRRRQISQVVAIFEAGSELLPGEFSRKRFTRLDAADQDAYIASWEESSVAQRRAIFTALKSVAAMGYWTRPDTWPAIGYGLAENPGVPSHVPAAQESDTP